MPLFKEITNANSLLYEVLAEKGNGLMKLGHLHYGWVIVIVAIFILAISALMQYTFGIFLRPLTMEFNWDRGTLSGAFSMYVLISGFLGIFAGRLSDKCGPRPLVTISGLFGGTGFLLMSQVSSLWQVYLIWGLIMGVAFSCCVIPVNSTIPRWFAKKRGIAVGIIVSGFGLGGLIGPLLAQWLISSYGWRQASIILGLITFIIIIPLAQFMKHSPERAGLRAYGEDGTIEDKQSLASIARGLSFKQAIKTGRFWLFGSIEFCFMFCLHLIMVHIAPYAVGIGISAIVGASVLSIIAGSSVIGRLSMGFISDKIGVRPALTACLVSVALALIWLLFAKEIWMLYAFAVIFGVGYGGFSSLFTLAPAKLFGLKFLGIILATVLLLGTIGGTVGPSLAGAIFDVTGGYSLALLICVISSMVAIILSLILLRAKVKGFKG